MPDTVKAMLDAAMKAGDEAAVNAIVKYAKAADKASVEVAEKAAGSWKRERREAAERRVREARFLDRSTKILTPSSCKKKEECPNHTITFSFAGIDFRSVFMEGMVSMGSV